MRVILKFVLLVYTTWIVSNEAKNGDDDPCEKVDCGEGKMCKTTTDPDLGDIAVCVVANDCECPDGHQCVREGNKKKCVCVVDDCLPKGEICGGGAFHCAYYQKCVDDARCCVADCESSFAKYMFKRPEPICVDDGVTYASLCLFDRDRCFRNDRSTFVSLTGEECLIGGRMCGSHQCGGDEICAKSSAGFRCCSATCPNEIAYLCGDDGHLHKNSCHLKRTSCIIGRNINVVERKSCDKECNLGKKKVSSGEIISLKGGCSDCQCNNGHWHCDHTACL